MVKIKIIFCQLNRKFNIHMYVHTFHRFKKPRLRVNTSDSAMSLIPSENCVTSKIKKCNSISTNSSKYTASRFFYFVRYFSLPAQIGLAYDNRTINEFIGNSRYEKPNLYKRNVSICQSDNRTRSIVNKWNKTLI